MSKVKLSLLRRTTRRNMRFCTSSDETGGSPRRARDDSGLTTLEWLLIVAAVAGLAALAVVLVQNVVSETSEQIAGSSARATAAKVAAASVVQEAMTFDTGKDRYETWNKWELYFTSKCNRIGITYSDANVTVAPEFAKATASTGGATPTETLLAAGVLLPPSPTYRKPLVK